jgi:RNase H-fold protein (predicted Holliday junction resolvase)
MVENDELKKQLTALEKLVKETEPKTIVIEKDMELDLSPPKAILDLEKKLKARLDRDDD